TFVADTAPFNAVRVAARRQVPTAFGRILGFRELDPATHSIAYLSGTGSATCLAPFGITQAVVDANGYGNVIDISSPSPGNWGKLDIGGNMSSNPVFVDGMVNGLCNTTVNVGDAISPGTGFAGVINGFDGRYDVNPFMLI